MTHSLRQRAARQELDVTPVASACTGNEVAHLKGHS